MKEIQLPDVRRVSTEAGSHVEPALDAKWSEPERLAWHAAVTAADTGLRIRLWSFESNGRDAYGLGIGSASSSSSDFYSAWTYLNGVAMGARAHAESVRCAS